MRINNAVDGLAFDPLARDGQSKPLAQDAANRAPDAVSPPPCGLHDLIDSSAFGTLKHRNQLGLLGLGSLARSYLRFRLDHCRRRRRVVGGLGCDRQVGCYGGAFRDRGRRGGHRGADGAAAGVGDIGGLALLDHQPLADQGRDHTENAGALDAGRQGEDRTIGSGGGGFEEGTLGCGKLVIHGCAPGRSGWQDRHPSASHYRSLSVRDPVNK